jgi:ESS family glutamate:Na+ symporter
MTFEMVENVFTINTDMTMTTAMAAALLILGYFIKSKVKFLEKYCIPAPVVGGFLFMLITWVGFTTGSFAFSFNTTLQSFFMLAFFTTVGLGASISHLKKAELYLLFTG